MIMLECQTREGFIRGDKYYDRIMQERNQVSVSDTGCKTVLSNLKAIGRHSCGKVTGSWSINRCGAT